MGDVIRDRYELLEVAGQGGEGTVMRSLDRQHDRIVALKIRTATTPERRDDLLTEARVLLAVPPHRHLALVREDFFDGDRYVIAMDWIEGTDLGTLLRLEGRPGLPVPSVLRWLADAASALTHLHTQDPAVVHGDVKPSNLILSNEGRLVLVDFGLSSTPAAGRGPGGTPGYVAPERSAGDQPSRATDVYGLAATAWALLTGAPPTGVRPTWDGLDPAVAAQLEDAVRSGLATDPARRPHTAGELVERIRAGWTSTLPTGVLTFCMTDIVGSTARWQDDPAGTAKDLVRHDDVIAAAVQAHGGRILKSMGEGDATVSVFERASDAVFAARDVHANLAAHPWVGAPLQVRVGLHTGEAEQRGDDYFGVALSVAARIRSEARAGEVLLSGSTAAVVVPALPDGWSLVDLGAHRLKGVAEMVPVWALAAPGVTAPPTPTVCPYPGLLPFDVEDRDRFVGREAIVADLVERVARGGFVTVVGSSGSGKSSLLRAGVVPRVPEAVVRRPADLLDGPIDPAAVLVVDQLEELFTAVDEPARDGLIAVLLAHPTTVVVALRADFYGRCAEHPVLAAAVASDQVLLGPMGADELRRAVREPAASMGLDVEAALVEQLVEEVAGELGALPLLSHALQETWRQRDGRTLTLDAYRRTGGVRGAIAASADELIASLDAADQRLARSIFLRLVEPGEDRADTRRRARLPELRPHDVGRERVDAVLTALASARLVTLGEETAEISHEALIRAWPQLTGWLDEDRAGLRVRRHLTSAASAWDDLGREASELYRGSRLALAVEWLERNPDVSELEREFLAASEAEAERAIADERRVATRLRRLLVGVGVALVAALAAGSLAVVQRGRATDERNQAQANRIAALSGTTIDDQAAVGMLLAATGFTMEDTSETRSALLGAVTAHPQLVGLYDDVAGVLSTAITPDGRRTLTAGSDGIVVWDARTQERLADLVPDEGIAVAVAVTPDGSRAVVGLAMQSTAGPVGGQLQVWNLDTYELEREVESPAGGLTTAAFFDEGRRLITQTGIAQDGGSESVAAIVWDTATWEPLDVWPLADEFPEYDAVTLTADGTLLAVPVGRGLLQVFSTVDRSPVGPPIDVSALLGQDAGRLLLLAFNPTASILAVTTEEDGRVVLLDPRAGSMVGSPLSIGGNSGTAVGFSPDGTVLAVAQSEGGIQLFDVASSRPIGPSMGVSPNHVRDMVWSPDSTRLTAFHSDDVGATWALDGERAIGTVLRGQGEAISDVAFVDRTTLVTAGADGSLAIRDPGTGEIRTLVAGEAPLRALAADDETARLVTADETGAVTLWDLAPLERTTTILEAGDRVVADLAVRPRSPEVAVGLADAGVVGVATDQEAVVAVVDLDTGRTPRTVEIPNAVVVDIAYSADGGLLAVATYGFEGAVHLYDARTLRLALEPITLEATSVGFTARGDELLVGTARGSVERYDVATGAPVTPALTGQPGGVEALAVSADGRWLASSTSVLGGTRLWDVRAGEQLGSDLIAGNVPVTLGELGFGQGPRAPRRTAFAPDGGHLAVAGAGGAAVLWDLRPSRWLAAACALAQRELTSQERSRWVRSDRGSGCRWA